MELTHTVKKVKKYEIKPEQLPKRDGNFKREIKRNTHDINRINRIYKRYAQQYSGMLNRTEEWWIQSILHNKQDIVTILSR
jgi:predicted acetyltransferase